MWDAWDGNWLQVTAHCADAGASVLVTGPILDTISFWRFERELKQLYERLEGTATLESYEPELRLTVRAKGATGLLDAQVDITPDVLKQQHRFSFSLDQSYLPAVLDGCHRLLTEYPIRDAAARGV